MDISGIAAAVAASAAFNTILGFVLNGILARRFEDKNNIRLEKIKSELGQELERARHTLQLEQTRLSFVYERQRESFTNVIRAMHKAITAVEAEFRYGDDEWKPVKQSVLESLRAVRVSESLYTGSDGDRALRLFENALSRCAFDPSDYPGPDSETVHHNVRIMDLIANRVQEFFRVKMGVAAGDPLLDVFRLDAYRLINLELTHGKFAPSPPLSNEDELAPEQIVELCRLHSTELLGDLGRLEQAIEESGRANTFFMYQEVSRAYRMLLSERPTPAHRGGIPPAPAGPSS